MSTIGPNDRIAVMSGAGTLSREAFDAFLSQAIPTGMRICTSEIPPLHEARHVPSPPTEIEIWNAAVDARRREKQLAKKGYAKP